MTHKRSMNIASGSSINDNAPKAARGKRGKKTPSGKRAEPESYPPEIADLTQKIKKIQGQELEARVQIGLGLSRAKELLAHGQFRPWVRREFRWSERTASNYMELARHYEGKTAKFADLDLGTAMALIAKSTPAEVRDEVFEQAATDKKITREDVRKRIAVVKAAAPQRPAKAKKADLSGAKSVEVEAYQIPRKPTSETTSVSLTTEGGTPSITGKSPIQEVAEALLSLLRALEKNSQYCKPDDIAELLVEGGSKPTPENIMDCTDFVGEVAAGIRVLIHSEPDIQAA